MSQADLEALLGHVARSLDPELSRSLPSILSESARPDDPSSSGPGIGGKRLPDARVHERGATGDAAQAFHVRLDRAVASPTSARARGDEDPVVDCASRRYFRWLERRFPRRDERDGLQRGAHAHAALQAGRSPTVGAGVSAQVMREYRRFRRCRRRQDPRDVILARQTDA